MIFVFIFGLLLTGAFAGLPHASVLAEVIQLTADHDDDHSHANGDAEEDASLDRDMKAFVAQEAEKAKSASSTRVPTISDDTTGEPENRQLRYNGKPDLLEGVEKPQRVFNNIRN